MQVYEKKHNWLASAWIDNLPKVILQKPGRRADLLRRLQTGGNP